MIEQSDVHRPEPLGMGGEADMLAGDPHIEHHPLAVHGGGRSLVETGFSLPSTEGDQKRRCDHRFAPRVVLRNALLERGSETGIVDQDHFPRLRVRPRGRPANRFQNPLQ